MNLSKDVLGLIALELDLTDLHNYSLTCGKFNQLLGDNNMLYYFLILNIILKKYTL